nr:DUF3393 domain-containing protein [Deltaproteobacteria bacterium]
VFSQQDELEKFRREQVESWKQYRAEEEEAFDQYKEQIEAIWNEYVRSSKKEWVEYSQDLDTRSYVNFEEGQIKVETVVAADEADIEDKGWEKIKEQTDKMFSREDVPGGTVLEGQVEYEPEMTVNRANINDFISSKVKPNLKVSPKPFLSKDGKKRIRVSVTIPMVPEHLRIRAQKYLHIVKKYTNKYDLDIPMVMAVIHTESYFNPLARSWANAHGLMQIVPKYAGRETHQYLFNEDKIPTASYLYKPDNNILLGTTYLYLLLKKYFNLVSGVNKRDYLVIASYNWGPHNVKLKIVSKYDHIDKLSDERLFAILQQRCPDETKGYLRKVTSRMENYEAWRE